jgi:hypothetical protein
MVWMTQNGMKLNVKKTQLMLLGNSHNVKELGQIELEIDGTTIVSQDTMNSLGLTIYSTMTWYDHINKISRSFHLSARSLYPLRPLLTENQFFDIFYTCAVSRINYMSILWGAANNCSHYLIEKKMRQAARILLYKNRQDPVRSDMYFYHTTCTYTTLWALSTQTFTILIHFLISQMFLLLFVKSIVTKRNKDEREPLCTQSSNKQLW